MPVSRRSRHSSLARLRSALARRLTALPRRTRRRLRASLATLLVVALLPLAAIVFKAPANAAPSAPVAARISSEFGTGSPVAFDADLTFTVAGMPTGAVKGLLVADRSPYDDKVNKLPYYRMAFEKPGGSSSMDLDVPQFSFQPGGTYRWRAQVWYPGQGEDPSPWSAWATFTSTSDPLNASAPYPLSPSGDVGSTGVVLRTDSSWKPVSGGPAVTRYAYELRTETEPDVIWSGEGAAPARGSSADAQIAVPDDVLGTGGSYRWRVVARTSDGGESQPSRWRYFRTLSRTLMDQQYWYIDNRAGSYVAGLGGGDEASGLVASKKYPGIYWFIRDASPTENRVALYALKMDTATGLLTNISGGTTKAIRVTATSNLDGGAAGIDNIDWEAVTVDDSGNLYIGDIGDFWDLRAKGRNGDSALPDTRVYKMPEPDPYTATSVNVSSVSTFHYPDNEKLNSESLFSRGGRLYTITKETNGTARLFRLDLANGTAAPLGRLAAHLDPVTDADVSRSGSYLAVTTASKRLVVFRNLGGSTGDQRIVDLATRPDRKSHYYYRSAAKLDADGLISRRLADPRFYSPTDSQPSESEQFTQLTMQVEGAAFQANGTGLGLISEFGQHVMFVPASDWSERPGDGYGDGWDHGSQPDLQGIPRPSAPQTADPVSTATGNFAHAETDLSSPTGVWGLDIGRTYNSLDTTAGPFGTGWSWSFGMKLAPTPDEVALTAPDGRVMSYVRMPTGGWDRPAEFTGELTSRTGGWKVSFVDGSSWEFDAAGQLTRLANWDGQSITVTRTGGRVTKLTSSLAESVTLSYNSEGRITSAAASNGRTTTFAYTGAALTAATRPGARTVRYAVGSAGLVTAVTDASGKPVVSNIYDTSRRVIQQTQNTGVVTTFSYAGDGSTSVSEGAGTTRLTYRHDGAGRVISVTDQFGKSLTNQYDHDGNPTTSLGRAGGVETKSWNARGVVTKVTDAAGATTSLATDATARPTSVTSPKGTIRLGYEGVERLPTTVTAPGGGVHTQDVANGLIKSTVDPDGVKSVFTYDAKHRVTAVANGLLEKTTFAYDAHGNRTAVTNAGGGITRYTYDAADRMTTMTAPDGGVTSYTYDGADRVLSVSDPTKSTTTYAYNSAGLAETVTYPGNRVVRYAYDAQGRVTSETDPAGGVTKSTYGPLGRLESTTDPRGNVTRYTYDSDGNIASVATPGEGTETASRDKAGRVTGSTSPAGKTSYTYDVNGNPKTVITPGGRTTTMSYDTQGRLLTSVDPRGAKTSYQYTGAGRVKAVLAPAGTTSYSYDASGRVSATTAPGGLKTANSYDKAGRLSKVTAPGGEVTIYAYDVAGNVTSTTDPAGLKTTYTWSARREMVTSKAGTAGTVRYTYNGDGTLAKATNANGGVTSYEYNGRGQRTAQIDPSGARRTYAYDLDGNLVGVTDPLNRKTTYGYDPAGRLATSTDPTGRVLTNTWNDAGLLTKQVAGTETSTFGYNSAGERTSAATPTGTWGWAYDNGGLLTSVSAPDGRTTRYTYDSAGRPASLTYPDGTKASYGYDAAGRLSAITSDRALADNFTAPNGARPDTSKWATRLVGAATAAVRNNVATLTFAASGTSSATLDATTKPRANTELTLRYSFSDAANDGRLRVGARTASGNGYRVELRADNATGYVYKTVGATTTEIGRFTGLGVAGWQRLKFQVSGSTLKVRQWADGAAEPSTWRSTVTDTALPAAGGLSIQWARGTKSGASVDVDDISLRDLAGATAVASYAWDASGHLTGETLPGGTRAWTWAGGRLTGYKQALAGAPAVGTTLGYDGAGRISRDVTDGVTTTFGYDAGSQLTSVSPSAGSPTTYSYDAAGRRTSVKSGSAGTTFAYDAAAQLTSATPTTGAATTYAYDGAGRRTSATTGGAATTYSYDPRGRLQHVAAPGNTQDRAYTPDGLLDTVTVKTAAGTTTSKLTWDPTSSVAELVAVYDGGTSNLTGVGGRPSAMFGGEATGIPEDAYGSVTAGRLARAAAYDSFGRPRSASTATGATLGYRGEVQFGDLSYLRSRDYDTVSGAFTTPDLLPDVPGTSVVGNPYHYANNSPVDQIDPTGLRPGSGALTDNAFDLANRLMAEEAERARLEWVWREEHPEFPAGTQLGDVTSGLYDGAKDTINPVNFVRGVWGTVRHPIDTVQSLTGAVNSLLSTTSDRVIQDVVLPALGAPMQKCRDKGLDYCVAFATGGLAIGAGVGTAAAKLAKVGRLARAVEEAEARGATNVVNGVRLGAQLARESAESVFTSSGRLQQEVIDGSRRIIPGSDISNPAVIKELTADGSKIAEWGKYSSRTFQSPSGPFQVHYYFNRSTGVVSYGQDYKVVFNGAAG